MPNKKFVGVILASTFVLALLASAYVLKPKPVKPDAVPARAVDTPLQEYAAPAKQLHDPAEPAPAGDVHEENIVASLSQSLQAVKDGKKSILTVIFSDEDLNQQLAELLALSDSGEAWADYAIGQLAEMCTYLYETPESSLIEMFSGVRLASSPEQQVQMSELLPVVVNASKRCKTLDAEQLKSLGNSRNWFDKAAAANNPNAFVVSGYSLVSERLFSESDEYATLAGEERRQLGQKLRDQARQEFRETMREFVATGEANPETVISMAEHLNLFYEDGHPLKSKEAWMLLACEQGYEDSCSSSSTAMSVFCMFDSLCATGGDFQQGVLWAQGQYKLDEYQRIADELKHIFATEDWDKLGF